MSGSLSSDAAERKAVPMASGLLDYFPAALAAVARLSQVANDQHNPGEPLHWARDKSSDHDDCLIRHFMDRGTIDTDGIRHRAKVAWRALAALQLECEREEGAPLPRNARVAESTTNVADLRTVEPPEVPDDHPALRDEGDNTGTLKAGEA